MTALTDIEQGIESMLAESPYIVDSSLRRNTLLELLKKEIAYACERNAGFQNYVEHWPVNFHDAREIADLPYMPVGVFKADPPLSLVAPEDVRRTLSSSATTGQIPSRVLLDAATARRMSKGALTIVRDFIGSTRRPYLVVDTAESLAVQGQIGARAAAIQALRSFATEIVCCMRAGEAGSPELELDKLLSCAAKWKDQEVLVYGFTYVIWTQLIQPLKRQGITLDLPNVRILHSGGWKRLEHQSVTRDVFNREVAAVFGSSPNRVIDYYGMVENVGVIYPDCEYGNKHVPAFADVIIRDPLTLAPLGPGRKGLIQVCSVLPTSFPGFLLLTEDTAQLIGDDSCLCGRRGPSFRFAGRLAKAEVRGCGNLESTRHREPQLSGVA